MTAEEAALKKEDRLLRLHRSYRNVFFGSIFLCITNIIGWGTMFDVESKNNEFGQFLGVLVWFWAAISVYARAKLDHIATIQRYRAKA